MNDNFGWRGVVRHGYGLAEEQKMVPCLSFHSAMNFVVKACLIDSQVEHGC